MQQLSLFQNSVQFPESYSELFSLYEKYIYENEKDLDVFTWSEIKNGRSYCFYGKKVMEFIPSETQKTRLKILLPNGEQIVLDSSTTSETLLSWLDKLKEAKRIIFRNLITDEFGCCNSFRICSDKGECIHQDERFYNGCYYRKNLEMGRNFYRDTFTKKEKHVYKSKDIENLECETGICDSHNNSFSSIIGLDFETANANRSSACAVAAVKYDLSGRLIDKYSTLINPHEPFDFFNILIHGIDEYMVADAPGIDEAMTGVFNLIDSESLVVCHNAAFDMSVLRYSLEGKTITIPDFTFTCTYRLASRVLPKNVSYSLPDVAEQCGLSGLIHHNAESDADTCAQILLYLINMFNGDVSKLHIAANIKFGHFENGEYGGIHKVARESYAGNNRRNNKLPNYIIGPESPFYGKTVAFTGKLESMTRMEAIEIINTIGGYGSETLTKKTNFLITGYQNPDVLAGKEKSSKQLLAEKMLAEGKNIEIIPEDMFIKML